MRTGAVILDDGIHVRASDVIIIAPEGQCQLDPEETSRITTVDIDADLLFDLVRWRFGRTLVARCDASAFLNGRYPTPVSRVRLPPDWTRLTSPWMDEIVTLTDDRAFVDRHYRLLAGFSILLDALLPHLGSASCSTRPEGRVSPAVPGGTACATGSYSRREAHDIDLLFRSDLTRRWVLEELAATVHLSPSQVRRVMISTYGRRPLAHLNRLRAEEAARLLRTEDISLTVAFRRVGWLNRGYAARVFTQVIGVSPAYYAAHHRPHS